MDETKNKPNINDLLDRHTYKFQPVPDRLEVKEFESSWEPKEKPECIALRMHESKETINKIVNEKGRLEGHPEFSYPKRQTATCKDVDLNTVDADDTIKMFIKLSGVGGDSENVKKVMGSVRQTTTREEVYPDLEPGPDSSNPDYKNGMLLFRTNGNWHRKDELRADIEKKRLAGMSGLFATVGKYLKGKTVSANTSNKLTVGGIATKFDVSKMQKAIQELANVISAREAERVVCRQVAKKIANVL